MRELGPLGPLQPITQEPRSYSKKVKPPTLPLRMRQSWPKHLKSAGSTYSTSSRLQASPTCCWTASRAEPSVGFIRIRFRIMHLPPHLTEPDLAARLDRFK